MELSEKLNYYRSLIARRDNAKNTNDKTKLIALVESLDIPLIVLTTESATIIHEDILKKFNSFKNWANEQINTLQ
ncbi:hypothetical protein UFOVP916_19 [uncultured Caudovirales phage]|uniref:Uncharacterized protein n=1 Tax=uncultured Caudovirales phage TaxID=2100421 RepID=A0A6J5PQB7_9CAUD|nr:hypothetical protein UFOVP827_40 [uncultured Caudovirales phage]CAB4171445.1 hypothetical protein UFOVP916_19 [uncultured Caudovirales phage]CAB4177415.1 hypothetical protein UFOVP1001_43 [uncultured Caudovirales phage]CAB4199293.1 hypothetical protein UFOVP1338_33 [uncultured Caudovirales phage]CAB4213429.1 hypothetical protein UFOVP1447_28 [uncultured Caudovirales phage]